MAYEFQLVVGQLCCQVRTYDTFKGPAIQHKQSDVLEDHICIDISHHRPFCESANVSIVSSYKNAERKHAGATEQLLSLNVSVSRRLVNVCVAQGSISHCVCCQFQQLILLLRPMQALKASWVIAAECHSPFARWVFIRVPHLLLF